MSSAPDGLSPEHSLMWIERKRERAKFALARLREIAPDLADEIERERKNKFEENVRLLRGDDEDIL